MHVQIGILAATPFHLMSSYIVSVIALALGRTLDLLSTWQATPDFKLELNRWMAFLGWRKVMLVNLVVVFLCPLVLGPEASMMIAMFSALIGV